MQKNVLLPVKLLAQQSMAANFTSPATVIKYTDNVCYQINATTTNSIGTFAVQTSLDYVPANDPAGPAVAGNWTTLALSGTPTINAASDTISINLNQVPASAIRLVYTSTTAGTGTCDIYITAKGLS